MLTLKRPLTRRQLEYLELLARGLNRHQIAHEMGLAATSVTQLRHRLALRARVRTDWALLRWARQVAALPSTEVGSS